MHWIGLTWDEPAQWQTAHTTRYDCAIAALADRGLLYECYCSRRDIAQAPRAPHAPQGAYPGTCLDLTDAERQRRRAEIDRPPALRLRTDAITQTVHDLMHGDYTGIVDDFVVRRGDGVTAYNLAVVVDDADRGIDQVVRGDDLLTSAPRQAHLAALLDLPPVQYAHVPLALNEHRQRLAKRDGAVTLADLAGAGVAAAPVLSLLATSVGLASPGEPVTPAQLLPRFDPAVLPREPWIVDPDRLTG